MPGPMTDTRSANIKPSPRSVLYFAENAISAIQGGGIVVYAVLKGLPADRLLGFFDYRNITPAPEYADRFVYLGPWRAPKALAAIGRIAGRFVARRLQRLFPERCIRKDFEFVRAQVQTRGFTPEVVYFSGLSYRYLRLAVMAAEYYDLPMVLLHMDDWMQVEREAAGPLGRWWYRRIVNQMRRAAERSLVSTTNSPRLAARCTDLTGFRHVPANNCCADLMASARAPERARPNRIPVITYAGAMNRNLQGETLKVLASAVTELNAEGTRVHLHIYTPWEFAPEANAVAVPHAVFYKGQVGRDRLPDVYRRADFLVTTVTYRDQHISLFRHSLSTKLSEYLCAGKPVISMGHKDWHLHEYVQDHGCGFSILMDNNFSRAAIKRQLIQILATEPATRQEIGRRNRELWERAHDVQVMAVATRRALRLDHVESGPGRRRVPDRTATASLTRRGALDIGGDAARSAKSFVPLDTLKQAARHLVDVFDHSEVDLSGRHPLSHPGLDDLLGYCHDIGLRPTLVIDEVEDLDHAACRRLADGFSNDVSLRIGTGADLARVEAALSALRSADMPARVVARLNGCEPARLDQITAIALETKPAAVALDFNPGDPPGAPANVKPWLSEVAPYVRRAVDTLEAAGIDATIRHFPFCLAGENHRKHIRHSLQLAYDIQAVDPAVAGWKVNRAALDRNGRLPRPEHLFEQVSRARGPQARHEVSSPEEKAINALSVRVPRNGPVRPVVWLYGSEVVGRQVIQAIESHEWLSEAVTIGGFLSSPGYCGGDTLFGHPWRSADSIALDRADIVLITSELSRLSIAETLAGLGLLDRAVHLYGTSSASHRYERGGDLPDVEGFGAADYATRECVTRAAAREQAANGQQCSICSLSAICDRLPAAYVARCGWAEASPIAGQPIADPRHFMRAHAQAV